MPPIFNSCAYKHTRGSPLSKAILGVPYNAAPNCDGWQLTAGGLWLQDMVAGGLRPRCGG